MALQGHDEPASVLIYARGPLSFFQFVIASELPTILA
jgi:hypothetical protein